MKQWNAEHLPCLASRLALVSSRICPPALAHCIRSGYACWPALEQVLFPPARVKPKFKGLVRMPPCDLTLANRCGSTVLTLLFGQWERRYNLRDGTWTVASSLCGRHAHPQELGRADLFAYNKQGQCALSQLADAANQLPTPPANANWQQRRDGERKKLPQQLLQAWQAARSPAVRSVQQA